MGSKSRLHLGFIIDLILHFHRNFFINTKIYMSKRIQEKIKIKHNDVYFLTSLKQFEHLMNSTIGSCKYNQIDNTINFIAYLESQKRFILYSLKSEKHHCICNTIFALNKDTLKKYYSDESFILYKKSYKKLIEENLY